MNTFIQLIVDLLISQAGSLVYHLVLIFSIVAGLQICFNFMDKERVEWMRMLLGFIMLLGVQLLLFIFSLFAWQGLFDARLWFPLIEKTASVISLLVIIWMWNFPKVSNLADSTTIILGFLVLALAVFSGAYITNSSLEGAISIRWFDRLFSLLSVFLTMFGSILLITRKTPGWETGLGQLIILGLGNLSLLFWAGTSEGYSAIVRFAELAAFPLVIALPQRYLELKGVELDLTKQPTQDDLFKFIKSVLSKPVPEQAGMELISQLARLFNLDFCLWMTFGGVDQQFDIRFAFNKMRNEILDLPPQQEQSIPLVIRSLQNDELLNLSSSSKTVEMDFFQELLGCNAIGSLLFIPINNHPQFQIGLLLISMDPKRDWMDQEKSMLLNVIVPLVYFLHLSEQMLILESNLKETENQLLSIQSTVSFEQSKMGTLLDENQQLLLQDQEKKSQVETLVLMISMQQETLSQYKARIKKLEMDLENQKDGISGDELKEWVFQFEELNQLIRSIQEQVSALITQAGRVLDLDQRKTTERILIASERAFQINEDLLNTFKIRVATNQKRFGSVDPTGIIKQSIARVISEIDQKEIHLKMDLPDGMPNLVCDGETLESILVDLLVYAGRVTPSNGEIIFRAYVGEDRGKADYVILQITDGGKGIPVEEMPYIFDSHNRKYTSEIKIDGGTEFDLSHIYDQVLSVKGRIWIDTEPGKGSTISLLLPTSPITQGENDLPGVES